MHLYADLRLQELIESQLKIMNTRLGYPLCFHPLSRNPEVILDDKVLTVTSFPLLHRYDAPVCGFCFGRRSGAGPYGKIWRLHGRCLSLLCNI